MASRGRVLAAAVATTVVALLVGVATQLQVTEAQSGPTRSSAGARGNPPPGVPTPHGTPTDASRPRRAPPQAPADAPAPGETAQQFRERQPVIFGGGRRISLADETRGKPIVIGRRTVQLPADAYVAGYVTHINCIQGRVCPQPPYYEIKRGQSVILVQISSGLIVSETTVPNESDVFTFLKEALR